MSANEVSMVIFLTDELGFGKNISKMKNKKSQGHEGISSEILNAVRQ